MTDVAKLATDYIRLWNEPDPNQRLVELQASWKVDATYVDPMGAAAGLSQINRFIEAVHANFPNHLFAMRGSPDGHGDHARFSWTLADEKGTVLARGTDMVAVDAGGRIASVVGFLDELNS